MASSRKSRRKRRSTAGGRPGRQRRSRTRSDSGTEPAAPLPSIAAERARRTQPAAIFEALATLLAPYAHLFEAEMHERMGYCLKTYGEWPTEVYFAGVQWDEEGIAYHLFPIASHPEIAAGLSSELQAHREGRVSFRFKGFEGRLFAELAQATARAYQGLILDGSLVLAAAA
jgi:hypothetical protein